MQRLNMAFLIFLYQIVLGGVLPELSFQFSNEGIVAFHILCLLSRPLVQILAVLSVIESILLGF